MFERIILTLFMCVTGLLLCSYDYTIYKLVGGIVCMAGITFAFIMEN